MTSLLVIGQQTLTGDRVNPSACSFFKERIEFFDTENGMSGEEDI
jgi:hypothetical protein